MLSDRGRSELTDSAESPRPRNVSAARTAGERAGRWEEPTPLWHTTGGGHERSADAQHAGWTAKSINGRSKGDGAIQRGRSSLIPMAIDASASMAGGAV